MKINTKQVLVIMQVIAWVVYIGLCIKTGAEIISLLVSLFVSPAAAENMYQGLDLAKVYDFGIRHYVGVASLVIALSGLKAHIFYLLIRVLSKLNIDYPFSPSMALRIEAISSITLGAGIVALIGSRYSDWLAKRGVGDFQHWGSSELLFMAGVVYIIALVFKRGTEIQSENDLTI